MDSWSSGSKPQQTSSSYNSIKCKKYITRPTLKCKPLNLNTTAFLLLCPYLFTYSMAPRKTKLDLLVSLSRKGSDQLLSRTFFHPLTVPDNPRQLQGHPKPPYLLSNHWMATHCTAELALIRIEPVIVCLPSAATGLRDYAGSMRLTVSARCPTYCSTGPTLLQNCCKGLIAKPVDT